jgi:predicted transcriptional regulator
MTPAEYRAKYGLPIDYPLVAASYAAQRSELAKGSGLGQKRGRKPRLVA